MASEKEYDELVIEIHKLYEEMFSVQERNSGNLGKSWRINLTYGGALTHAGITNLYGFGAIFRSFDVLVIVNYFVVKKFFGDDAEKFIQARQKFRKKWNEVLQNIDKFINASNSGREIPFEALAEYYQALQSIRKNPVFRYFFLHRTFKEYVEEAVKYFESKKISIAQAQHEAVMLKV